MQNHPFSSSAFLHVTDIMQFAAYETWRKNWTKLKKMAINMLFKIGYSDNAI